MAGGEWRRKGDKPGEERNTHISGASENMIRPSFEQEETLSRTELRLGTRPGKGGYYCALMTVSSGCVKGDFTVPFCDANMA